MADSKPKSDELPYPGLEVAQHSGLEVVPPFDAQGSLIPVLDSSPEVLHKEAEYTEVEKQDNTMAKPSTRKRTLLIFSAVILLLVVGIVAGTVGGILTKQHHS
jgi:hypothetical protein